MIGFGVRFGDLAVHKYTLRVCVFAALISVHGVNTVFALRKRS